MDLSHPELTVALALAVGIMAQSVSRLLRLPGIVLLLACGALLGPEGAGWIQPRALGQGLFGIVDFGVAIILFEGGLNLEWSRLKRQEAVIRRLITWGTLTTLVGATTLAGLALGWRWDLAILFGALVVVTGPTVVQPLLRDLRLRPRLKTILEAEGVLIDPIGALLAGFILQLVIRPGVRTLAAQTGGIAVSIGFGLLAGLAAGFLLAGALRYRLIGDPRDDRTMQRARMELVGTVIGLTFSEHANSLFVREAREAYGVARGYVAMESFEDQHAPRLVRRSRLDVLFDGPHDQACWDVRWRHDEVDVEGFEYRLDVAPGSVTPDTGNAKTGTPGADQGPEDPYAILTVRRGQRPAQFRLDHDPRQGDIATVAIHRPARQAAVAHLGRRGWHPQAESVASVPAAL